MSPQQAGIPGATVAGLAGDVGAISAAGTELEGHILAAQRQLAAKQGELALDKHAEKTYEDLRKTTTPEQAQEVLDNAQKEAVKVLEPYGKDPLVSRALDMYRQRIDLEMEHTTNARKTQIITEQDKAANTLLGEKALQEAITEVRGGGNPSAARTKFELQLQSSVAHGTMTPDQVKLAMNEWDKELQMGVLKAGYNSPNPAERQQVIQQLRTGKGNLDLSKLDQGTLNSVLSTAQEVDKRLNELAESQNFNVVANNMAETFKSLGITGDFDSQLKWLEDGDHLKSIGAIDPSTGVPDRKMGERLQEDVERQRGYHKQIQDDEDNKALDKYSPMIDKHQLSIAQIDQIEGISPRARATLIEKQRQEERITRAEAREDRAEARTNLQYERDKDFNRLLPLAATGKMMPQQLLDHYSSPKNKLNYTQYAELSKIAAANDPDTSVAIDYIKNSFLAPKGSSVEDFARNEAMQRLTYEQWIKGVKEKQLTGFDKVKYAKEVMDFTNQKAITEQVDKIFGKKPSPTFSDYLKAAIRVETGIDLAPKVPEEKPPDRPKNVPANAKWNPQANNGKGAWELKP